MKAILTFSLICTWAVSNLFGQGSEVPLVLDTIFANEYKNVALFFPDPIKRGITGSENFVFSYNREARQHLGLLQATPGNNSNLLVISNEGLVFSFIITYAEHLDKLNYFFREDQSIGNEDPEFRSQVLEPSEAINEAEKQAFAEGEVFRKFSAYLLRSSQRLGGYSTSEQGIKLTLANLVFREDALYFVMEIENKSSIDYEVNFLNISVETRQKGKKKSMQKLMQQPMYTFLEPTTIKIGKTSRFVYVLPKFSIATDKIVVLDLKEENGERDIKVRLKHRIINNPH